MSSTEDAPHLCGELAVVVPTRSRPHLLAAALRSIAEQSLRPAVVMVVDSSPDHAERQAVMDVVSGAGVPGHYVFSSYGSAAHQRNLGVDALAGVGLFRYIAFLDDDTRPERDYLGRLVELLERMGPSALGASGTTGPVLRVARPMWQRYRRFFLLSGDTEGALLRSGVNVAVDCRTPGPVRAEWLFGCSVWRAEVFQTLRFRADFPGSSLGEDVEFSARAAKVGTLWVDTAAHLAHLLADEGRPDPRLHAYRWIRNRYEIVRSVDGTPLGYVAFWWSVVGEGLVYARRAGPHLLGRRHDDHAEHIARWNGLVAGVVDTVRRRAPQ